MKLEDIDYQFKKAMPDYEEVLSILFKKELYEKEVTVKAVREVLDSLTDTKGKKFSAEVKSFRMTFLYVMRKLFPETYGEKKVERTKKDLFMKSVQDMGREAFVKKLADLIQYVGSEKDTVKKRISMLQRVQIENHTISGSTIMTVCRELGWAEDLSYEIANVLNIDVRDRELPYPIRADLRIKEVKALVEEHWDVLMTGGTMWRVPTLREKLDFISSYSEVFSGMKPSKILHELFPALKTVISPKEFREGGRTRSRVGVQSTDHYSGTTVHTYTG